MNPQMRNNLGVIRFTNAQKSEPSSSHITNNSNELRALKAENQLLQESLSVLLANLVNKSDTPKEPQQKPKPPVTVTKQEKQQAFEQRLLNPCAHNIRMMGFRLT